MTIGLLCVMLFLTTQCKMYDCCVSMTFSSIVRGSSHFASKTAWKTRPLFGSCHMTCGACTAFWKLKHSQLCVVPLHLEKKRALCSLFKHDCHTPTFNNNVLAHAKDAKCERPLMRLIYNYLSCFSSHRNQRHFTSLVQLFHVFVGLFFNVPTQMCVLNQLKVISDVNKAAISFNQSICSW